MECEGDVAGALLQKHGYQEIKDVGEGSFGRALLVRTPDGRKAVGKVVDLRNCSSEKQAEDVVREGRMLASLRHPYVVRYHDSFHGEGHLCIIMDYCEGGDLAGQISQAKEAQVPFMEEQILKWFTQTVFALKYIHEKHILHRDIKPSNLFLSGKGSIKLGDFGVAKEMKNTWSVAKTQIGTPHYLSPELCQGQTYSWPSDMWALGCVLYELCALKVPFSGGGHGSLPALVSAILGTRVPVIPNSYSEFLRELSKDMLHRMPEKRPRPSQILALRGIQSIVRHMLYEAHQGPPPAAGGESGSGSISRERLTESELSDDSEGKEATLRPGWKDRCDSGRDQCEQRLQRGRDLSTERLMMRENSVPIMTRDNSGRSSVPPPPETASTVKHQRSSSQNQRGNIYQFLPSPCRARSKERSRSGASSPFFAASPSLLNGGALLMAPRQ